MEQINPLIQLGAIGVMLYLVWQALEKKNTEHKNFVDETIKSLKEMVIQVTTALVQKNVTDDNIADAICNLTEELEKLKGNNNVTK